MVAGTFHVPSAIQKPLVFEATAHGVCLFFFCGIPKNHNLSVPCAFFVWHALSDSGGRDEVN